MERYKMTREILKVNVDVDNIGGLGLKQQRKRVSWSQNFHENACVQNSTKFREKYKATTEIMKINLVIESIGGLGSKQQRKLVNWGQNLHENACV